MNANFYLLTKRNGDTICIREKRVNETPAYLKKIYKAYKCTEIEM